VSGTAKSSISKAGTKFSYFVAAVWISWIGAGLAYLGFVLPGLLWCSNFVSNESISLMFVFIVGCVGVAVWGAGLGVLCLIMTVE
jgi:hypothetical protein